MAQSAMGTKLKKGVTAVAQLTSIGGLDLSADTIETTTLDSTDGFRTYQQGLKDGGEVSISGFFDPTSHEGLLDDFESGVAATYTIEFPTALGAKWEFSGIVTAYSTSAEMEDNISFEATLKVSGKPTLTVTAV
jgi:predicted secreted protein